MCHPGPERTHQRAPWQAHEIASCVPDPAATSVDGCSLGLQRSVRSDGRGHGSTLRLGHSHARCRWRTAPRDLDVLNAPVLRGLDIAPHVDVDELLVSGRRSVADGPRAFQAGDFHLRATNETLLFEIRGDCNDSNTRIQWDSARSLVRPTIGLRSSGVECGCFHDQPLLTGAGSRDYRMKDQQGSGNVSH